MVIKVTIGEKIKHFRNNLGLTQTQLANAAGLHPVSIRKYETNKTQPQFPQIQKIADVLNVSPNALTDLESANLRLETIGDFMSILFLLINTGKISIEGQRNSNGALEPSSISLTIQDSFIRSNLSNWEKADYLYQKVLEQKDALPKEAYQAALEEMERLKEKVILQSEESAILLNSDRKIAVKTPPDISKYLK